MKQWDAGCPNFRFYLYLCLFLFVPHSGKGQEDSTYSREKILEMKELQVKGSKILLVQQGDTLVYNADMLRLAAGATLDVLINALPHAKIDRNGLITVKGEPIKELLIEGRDFFNGDPAVALKNLPAFTVHKVKVYRRVPRDAYLVRKDKGKKALHTDPLVMDVRLKAKYQNGIIVNLESASGLPMKSADKYLYLDRIFGMYYNKRRSLSAYAGLNNINDNGRPQAEGIWRDNNVTEGEESHVLGGLDYTYTNPVNRMEIGSKMKISHSHQVIQSGSSSMKYLSDGQLHGLSLSEFDARTLSAGWDGKLFFPGSTYTISLVPSLLISKGSTHSESRASSFSEQQNFNNQVSFIDSLFSLSPNNLWHVPFLTNLQTMETDNEGTGINVGSVARVNLRIPFLPNILKLSMLCNYHSNCMSGHTSNYIDYVSKGEIQRKLQTDDSPSRRSNIELSMENDIFYHQENGRLTKLAISYQGRRTYLEREHEVYVKDTALTWNPTISDNSLTFVNAMPYILDTQNSYHVAETEFQNTLSCSFTYTLRNGAVLQTTIPLSVKNRDIADTRGGETLSISRTDWLFDPNASFFFNGFTFGYRISTGVPPMSSFLDRIDDSNPLYIRLGNPSLKSSITHIPNLRYSKRWNKKDAYLNLSVNYQSKHNAIKLMQYYDVQTGVLTVQNRNVDGDWSSNIRGHFQTMLDKRKQWNLITDVNMIYGEENIFDRQIAENEQQKRTVRNWIFSTMTELDFHYNDWSIIVSGECNWQHSSGSQMSYHNISYSDFLYGIGIRTPVYRGFSAGTTFTSHTYRGAVDPSINRTYYVWNMDANYDFSDKWSLKIEGLDLLHQLSSTSTNSSALGWSEGWKNTRPSYCMLHIMYRFNILPK